MNRYQTVLVNEFRRRGALRASELTVALGVSQPTVSRLLSGMGAGRLVRTGRGRSSRYAMLRELAGIGSRWPLYEIDQDGRILQMGYLHALESRQWFLEQDDVWDSLRDEEFRDGLYPGLPWFLYDLRPQGFLGRCFAQAYSGMLGASADPREWSDDDIVSALLRFGDDVCGAFVLGEDMLSTVQRRMLSAPMTISITSREEIYPDVADRTLDGQFPGSSAGGEQPKFTACLREDDGNLRHVIVKFSGSAGRAEDRRWADLLFAEDVANRVLRAHGFSTAETCIIESSGRVFLESIRFDRIGAFGRRGMVSLEALDSAFFGQIDTSWVEASGRLRLRGILDEAEAEMLAGLWWFGTLIGNSDMHYGNVSLFTDRNLPLSLTPTYDMVPMRYRPNIEGRYMSDPISPPPPPPEVMAVWEKAAIAAEEFWSEVASQSGVSEEFQSIASQNAKVVEMYRQRF